MGHHTADRPSPLRRLKSKRLMIATLAAAAVLAAAGTASALVGGLGQPPESAATVITIPDAQTSAPQAPAAASTDPAAAEQAQKSREEAVRGAALSGQSQTEAEQREEEPEEPEPASDDSGGGSDSGQDASGLTPTGEGGQCEASMYGDPQPTASGETFDPSAMTAAHKELPFDTMVQVTNTANGKSVTVRINDRGPFISGRCLDLSTASFTTIAAANQGVAQVEWEIVN